MLRIRRAAGMQELTVSVEGPRTLLDVLESIRSSRDPSLMYRHSCHHGSCGTCGALVDGVPRLLCLTPLSELGDTITVEPLPKATLIADVAVHPGPVFRGIPLDAPYRRGSGAQRLEDCIECGLCNAACPVAGPFVGPAALAAVHRTRELDPSRSAEMLRRAAEPDAVSSCVRAFACSRACPMGVRPGTRIQELRVALRDEQRPGEPRLP